MLILMVMIPGSGYPAAMSLLDAAKNGDTSTVKALIEKGADVNQQGQYGYTPLMWAIERGHTGTALLLINRGADVNIQSERSWTPLIFAVNKGQSKIAQLLLDKGADVNWMLDGGWTPLSLAAQIKRPDIIKLLLSKNADVDLTIGGLEKMSAQGKLIGREEAQKNIELLLKAKEEYVQAAGKKQETVSKKTIRSDIDNIPIASPRQKKNAYALVIGIEEYREKLPKAEYAADDARLFAEYLIKVLGYPEENVIVLVNDRATKSDLEKYFHRWLPNNVTSGGEVFVYYSGHGSPGLDGNEAFIVPFDGDPAYIADTGYSLKRLYEALGKLPSRDNYVVMDSCFSGAGGRSVIAKGLRPLVITTLNQQVIKANTTVLSASSAEQVSSTYLEKGHGLLTYYVLKGLKEVNQEGQINFETIYPYIKKNVELVARKQYNNEQSPQLWVRGKKAGFEK